MPGGADRRRDHETRRFIAKSAAGRPTKKLSTPLLNDLRRDELEIDFCGNWRGFSAIIAQ